MSNTVTYFQTTLRSSKLISNLLAATPVLSTITTDYGAEVAALGDVINFTKLQTFTAADKAIGSVYANTDLAPSQVQLTINKHKHVTFTPDNKERAVSAMDAYMNGLLANAIHALAAQVTDDVVALRSDVSTNSVGTGATDLDLQTVRKSMTKLDDGNVPEDSRTLLLDTGENSYGNLVDPANDTTVNAVILANLGNSGMNVVQTGKVSPLYKYGSVVTTSLVDTATVGSDTYVYNMGYHKEAFAFLARALGDVGPGVMQEDITDPNSGLSIRHTWGGDKHYNTIEHTVELLYGVKTLDEAKACLLLA